jgi:RimJ/RimL family protein N-acetyltransferase
MGRKLMHTKEDARWNFDWLKDKEERCYGLVYKETRQIIGNLTICPVPSKLAELDDLKAKVGKSLSFSISKSYQRKGLMLEAVNAVIKQLFNIEGFDYIQCGHYPINTASEMLQKKIGFEYLTTLRFVAEKVEIISVENILWKENK